MHQGIWNLVYDRDKQSIDPNEGGKNDRQFGYQLHEVQYFISGDDSRSEHTPRPEAVQEAWREQYPLVPLASGPATQMR